MFACAMRILYEQCSVIELHCVVYSDVKIHVRLNECVMEKVVLVLSEENISKG